MSNISTMCTRSVQRVVQLVAWMNAAWRSSFRQIHIQHWPLFVWHLWHHSLKICLYISSLIWLLLSLWTVIGRQKLNVLAVLKPDLDSRPFPWCVRPLHMHRRIIMSHNLVTEFKETLSHNTIGTQIAIHRDMTSKIQICVILPQLTQGLSPRLRPNPISIWWFAGRAICRGKSVRVHHTSLSATVTNQALRGVLDRVYSCLTVASQTIPSYDWILVKKSIAAFAIFWGQCQDTP